MNRRNVIIVSTAAALGAAFLPVLAAAQQPADIEAVKVANAAFYTALSALDAKAMGALWANKPDVVNIGPFSKVAAVGYEDAVTKYWANAFTNVFTELSASMTSTVQIQTDGKLAYLIGTERASGKTKAGPVAFETFATNIFEKSGDRWLMVSHHAQMLPK